MLRLNCLERYKRIFYCDLSRAQNNKQIDVFVLPGHIWTMKCVSMVDDSEHRKCGALEC